jgi:hypothetical protein
MLFSGAIAFSLILKFGEESDRTGGKRLTWNRFLEKLLVT